MTPTPAPAQQRNPSAAATGLELHAALRQSLPKLRWRRIRRIDAGSDHVVLELDRSWIVRLPRRRLPLGLVDEAHLLGILASTSPLRVPSYCFVAPDGSIGIYRRIPGRELCAASVRSNGPAIMTAVGDFLNALHAIPAATASLPSAASAADEAANFRIRERPLISGFIRNSTLCRLDGLFADLCDADPGPRRIIHGDFDARHILVCGPRIGGIIDFSDAVLGDPARDFAGLWSFGEWAPRAALAAYGGADQASLLRRSRLLYLRGVTSYLWKACREQGLRQIAQLEPLIEQHSQALSGKPAKARGKACLDTRTYPYPS